MAFPHTKSSFADEREKERKKKERSAEEQSAIVSVSSSALDNTEFAL